MARRNARADDDSFERLGSPQPEATRDDDDADLCDRPAAGGPASADCLGGGSDEGFVHVTRPLMTVRQFTDWVRDVRLPNADAVMQGRLEDDTIQALVARPTFLRDLLASFDARLRKGATTTADATPTAEPSSHDDVAVEGDAWPRLWAQFVRDLPREELRIEGELLSPPADAAGAQDLAIDPAGYAADVVLPKLRACIARRLPPASPTDGDGAVPSSTPGSKQAPTHGGIGIMRGLATILGLGGNTSPMAASPSDGGASAGPDSAYPTPPGIPEGNTAAGGHRADVVEGYARLAVLMAQQAVLALPLEIISAQFCTDIDARLFVGELQRADPRSAGSGMRVSLDGPPDGRAHGAVLSVSKTFRVFSIADDDGDTDFGGGGRPSDYTLFYVSVTIELDLLARSSNGAGGSGGRHQQAADDHVSIVWRVEPATAPSHTVTRGDAAATQQAAPLSPASAPPGSPGYTRVRPCDCLGASSGYHQATCPINWAAADP
uniref:Uncharacterized protein n=1 Tax=Neobodo designis TaxID=312471 RepID=A0A7S1QAJ3_NEODS|mmetsp:Transcript_38696/g.119604  ORF Transcript_38696/g.119604 Transcript_38696/m.119604 type:complete len:493 (+) Transcript_38696:1-1479(+)